MSAAMDAIKEWERQMEQLFWRQYHFTTTLESSGTLMHLAPLRRDGFPPNDEDWQRFDEWRTRLLLENRDRDLAQREVEDSKVEIQQAFAEWDAEWTRQEQLLQHTRDQLAEKDERLREQAEQLWQLNRQLDEQAEELRRYREQDAASQTHTT